MYYHSLLLRPKSETDGLTYFKGKPIEVNPEDYFNDFMIVIVLTYQYI
jgi:hypothetical protein